MIALQTHNVTILTQSTACWSILSNDIMTWTHFLYYWPFVWGIHQFPVVSLHFEPVMQSFDDFFAVNLKEPLVNSQVAREMIWLMSYIVHNNLGLICSLTQQHLCGNITDVLTWKTVSWVETYWSWENGHWILLETFSTIKSTFIWIIEWYVTFVCLH